MEDVPVDVRRRVKLRLSDAVDPFAIELGDVIIARSSEGEPREFLFRCFGCGEPASVRFAAGVCDGLPTPRWTVHGDPMNIEHLTVTPSVLSTCCGWHGYITNGEAVPC